MTSATSTNLFANSPELIIIFLSIAMIFGEYFYSSGPIFFLAQCVGLLVAAGYVLLRYKRHPKFTLSYFYPIYSFLGLLFSLTVITSGTYMFEIGKHGYANGSFWICLIFFVAGMKSALAGYLRLDGDKVLSIPQLPTFLTKTILYSVPTVLIFSAFILLITLGSPIALNVTRVAFWQEIAPSWLSRFPSIFGQSFFIVAFLYFFSIKNNRKFALPCIALFLYCFLTFYLLGEKFSTFIIYLTAWCAIWAGFAKSYPIRFRYIVAAILVLFAMVSLVMWSYASSGRGLDFIVLRIALQAQLMWSVTNESIGTLLTGSDWTCFWSCQNYEKGTEYISDRYMTGTLFQQYQITGSRLTGFSPSLLILTLGIPAALLLHVASSFFLGYIQRYLVLSIEQQNVLVSLLVFKVYFGLTVFWYAFDPYVLRGVVLTAAVLAVLFIAWRISPRFAKGWLGS